ncbi:hypothetical protein [Haloferula sargassicola]|uniref:hypothetical protein n=1 Tax=Haloferula sargassicola TaxID=490096 RepID=UPI00336553F8
MILPLGCLSGAEPQPLTFQIIHGLPEGFATSTALAVSGDGRVVAGRSSTDSQTEEAFIWTADEGISSPHAIASSAGSSSLVALSADGSQGVVSRFSEAAGSVWSSTDGLDDLLPLPSFGFSFSNGFDISSDGGRVVGQSSTQSGVHAALWTPGALTVDLGTLPIGSGDLSSTGYAISGDGTIAVGACTAGSNTVAFKWTDDTMTSLGDLPGGDMRSAATGISADGSVIVGWGTDFDGSTGVVFHPGWPEPVGDLDGGETDSQLLDVTADGSMAVGYGTDDSGRQAVIWDPAHGLRRISELLADAGMDLAAWSLTEAVAISDDGDVLVGNGIAPGGTANGWVVRGWSSLIAGGGQAAVIDPVVVRVNVRLAEGLRLGSEMIATVTAEGDSIPVTMTGPMSGGPITRLFYLSRGSTYTFRASLGNWVGLPETTLTLDESTSVDLVLDLDSDGDGLGDTAEEDEYGTDPDLADTDGDGFDDGFEVGAGLSPTDPGEPAEGEPAIDMETPEAISIRFYAAAGVDYEVQSSTDLSHWQALEEVVAGEGRLVELEIVGESPEKRFFRLLRSPGS